jgi:choline-sulfatase/uncharacterized sulfatase
MSKPNVLYIMSDQHNAKLTGYAGHPTVQTPNLDRLAAEGVRFDNAIAQNPICTPSRTSFHSGQYCHNHGYYGLNGRNPNGLPSVFGHFRKHGYRTAAVGKIHCPEYWIEDDTELFREVAPGCSIVGAPEYLGYLKNRGVTDAFYESAGAAHPMTGQLLDGFPSLMKYGDSQEAFSVREASHFMRDCVEADAPFLAHVSLPKPHQVYEPAREFWELYPEGVLELPPNADYDLSRKAPHLRATAESYRSGEWTRFEPRTFEAGRLRKLRGYLGCISHVDHAVGGLLDTLDELGIADETIVIYTADHGDYATEHGLMEKAPGICSDAITRIPLVMRLPSRAASESARGIVRGEVVEAVDLAPTLCDLAGLDPMATADGDSLAPLLTADGALEPHVSASWGRVATVPDQPLAHKPTAGIGVTEFPWSTSIRMGAFRLVLYTANRFAEYPNGFGELYNLGADPWEMTNLYFDPAHRERVASMTDAMMRWRMATSRVTTVLPWAVESGREYTTRYGNSYAADGRIGRNETLRARERTGLDNYL